MNTMKRKGFTLVELLVVIAILAILATVSVVGYTAFIERASVSNDQNIAAQLNKFLVAYNADHTSKHYGKDVNEGNIREITQEILDLGGLDELVPQSLDHGYHFYYDLQEDKYVVGKLNEQGLLETLVHAADNNGAHLGSCFTEDGRYFLVDTAGSDLADIVNGLYEAKSEADIQAALEKASTLADEPSQVINKIQDYVASVNVIIEGTQYVTNAEGTTNVVFTDGTTWVGTDVVVVGNPEATGSGFVVNNSGSTIVIVVPDSVKYIEVGAMNTSGSNTVVIVINKPSSEVANMANGSFTNGTLDLEDGDFTTTDDGHITNADGSTKLELKYENAFVDFKVVVENTDTTKQIYDADGNKTNSGYVSWDLDEFLLKFDAVGEDASIPATGLENATWEIVNDIDFARLEGNKVIFDKAKTPSQDIVVKATATNAKGEVVTREFTAKIVRITGAEFTIGGDKVNELDKVANLVCDNLSGTDFVVIPTFTYSYNNTGIKLAEDLFLSFESEGHTHGEACCPHVKHDGNCLICTHTCNNDCAYSSCNHTTHTDDCCGHTHTSACYEGNCTHVVGGAHTKADGTSCFANCAAAHTSHSYNCSQHYYETIWSKGPLHEHTDACCGHVNGTYHTKACGGSATYGGSDETCTYKTEGSHEHSKACCMYNSNSRGIDFSSGDYCVHKLGYHNADGVLVEYHLSGCGTCEHFTNGEHDSCTSTLICGHTDGVAHNCDECKHKVSGHECTELKCKFTCTGTGDCVECTHDCEKEGCESKCTYQSAAINGSSIRGFGSDSGTLTINVGKEGSYSYTFADITLNFYGDFETDIKGNVTHLGNANVVKVEDLFGNGVPTDAKIYIYDAKRVNHATDNFMFPDRTLLTLKSEASAMGETFYVEDNVIEYKNGAWEEIKFYGTGEVYIAVVSNDGVRLSDDVEAEVVAGTNVRDYGELNASTSNVLLKDITMTANGQFTFRTNGGSIYGNHYTFDIQQGVKINANGIIVLDNTNMQDLRVIGAYYPEVAIAGLFEYGTNAVLAKGNVTIDNCYIANTRSPLAAGYENDDVADVITVKDSVIYGGRYSNIDLREGTLIFEGKVITINQPHTTEKNVASVDEDLKVAGLGVTIWFEADEANIYGVQNLVQYNFVSENFKGLPDVTVDYPAYSVAETIDVKGFFKEIFGNEEKYSDYYFEKDGEVYMNASIICEDLGKKFSDAYEFKMHIPYGDRTKFENGTTPVGYQYVAYNTTIVNGFYPVTIHVYGLMNTDAHNQMFEDSQDAEFIYSPWTHIVGEETYDAYGFGSDNSIILR